MIKILLLCLLMVLIASSYQISLAQRGVGRPIEGKAVIKGRIIDSVSNQPISYVTISLLSLPDSMVVNCAISKDDGSFIIDKVASGIYTMKISFISYGSVFRNNIEVTSSNNNYDFGTIKLTPKSVMSGEVEVTAEKDIVSYKIDKKIINVAEVLGAKGGTAADALRNTPSVNIDPDGNITLRGSANFQVMIDGKPTIMSGQDVLNHLPASSVESIEIITNPSAKYDPAGTSGIVNIILRKEKMNAFSGIVNSSVGTNDKYNGDLTVNYREGSTNLFFSLEGNSSRYLPTSDFMRETYYNDTTFFVHSVMNRAMKINGYKLNFGIDQDISELSSISISADAGYFGFDRFFPTKFSDWKNVDVNKNYSVNNDDFFLDGNYYTGNTNFQQSFDDAGHKINCNVYFGHWEGKRNEDMSKMITDQDFNLFNAQAIKYRNDERQNKSHNIIKLEYTLPIDEVSKFEAGYEGSMEWLNSGFLYEDFDTLAQTWNKNLNYSNDLSFNQVTEAVYAMYSNSIFDIDFQLGLRGEYFYRNLDQKTLGVQYRFEDFTLYPTLHITKQLPDFHQIQFSYSRRVNRPDARILNPFPDYVDDYYVSKGNPALEPEYTDSYELNYRKSIGQSFISIEGYYRQTDKSITRSNEIIENDKLLLTYVNLNKDYLYGAEISTYWTVFSWLRFNASCNYFNYNLVENYDGQEHHNNRNIFDANAMLNLIISQDTYIQLSGYYQGPRLLADGEMQKIYTFGFAIRQDFFEHALTVALRGHDFLGTADYKFNNFRDNYKSYGSFDPESPTFTLSLSYKINNFKKQQREGETFDIQPPTVGF